MLALQRRLWWQISQPPPIQALFVRTHRQAHTRALTLMIRG